MTDNESTNGALSVPKPGFKSGFVGIIGKPNAGKSTLMNALVGQKVAIVSQKPQTTRDRIAGILTTDDYQVVFVDTPGVIAPKDRFNEVLMYRVSQAVEDVDVLYHLVDATDRDEPPADEVRHALDTAKPRVRFLILNKVDELKGRLAIPPSWVDAKRYADVFRVSALRHTGLKELIRATVGRLDPGPLYYDPEQLTDRDERFVAAEIVREKVFRNLGAELPYAVFSETEEFAEREEKDYIRVVIYVERDSQKGIIIGEGGRMLKKIGREARAEIEELTGRPSFLELWVKVRKNWRKNEGDLANFGFKKGKKKKR